MLSPVGGNRISNVSMVGLLDTQDASVFKQMETTVLRWRLGGSKLVDIKPVNSRDSWTAGHK